MKTTKPESEKISSTELGEHSLAATAHHEAGHTVIDYRFGLDVNYVTIQPNAEKGSLGNSSSDYDRRSGTITLEHLVQIIVSLLADYAAECRYGTTESIAREGAADEFERAEDWLQRAEAGKDPSTIENWIPKARQLVEENWHAIQAIAQELLTHETLDDAEIESIIQYADSGDPELLEGLAKYRLHRKVGTTQA